MHDWDDVAAPQIDSHGDLESMLPVPELGSNNVLDVTLLIASQSESNSITSGLESVRIQSECLLNVKVVFDNRLRWKLDHIAKRE